MQSSNFKIPLIPLNLRPEEYRIQVAEAFQHLKTVKLKVFEKINDRIISKRNNLQDIKFRIIQCQERIEKLRGICN